MGRAEDEPKATRADLIPLAAVAFPYLGGKGVLGCDRDISYSHTPGKLMDMGSLLKILLKTMLETIRKTPMSTVKGSLVSKPNITSSSYKGSGYRKGLWASPESGILMALANSEALPWKHDSETRESNEL